jgi:hypothetical protein
MSTITFYHILKYLHLIGLIFVVGNTFAIIGINSYVKTVSIKFSTYYALVKRFNRLLNIGLFISITSGLLMLFYVDVVHPIFDIKMTLLVINIIILGWTGHGTLAKYKRNVSNGENPDERIDKVESKFVNGFIIGGIIWLLIIALALLV